MPYNARPTPINPLLSALRMEPWGVDYLGTVQDLSGVDTYVDIGSAAGGTAHEQLTGEALSAELNVHDWRPVVPQQPASFERVMFQDGTRRIEARTYLEGNPTLFGALGSCAVGAVVCSTKGIESGVGVQGAVTASPPARVPAAEFVGQPVVQRWLALSGGRPELKGQTLTVGTGKQTADYRVTTEDSTDSEHAADSLDAPVQLLNRRMQDAERDLAARLLATLGEGLLICDGPRPSVGPDPRVIGYVKTVHAQRLPASALRVVMSLKQGERSPLYVVSTGQFAYFEWYLRLKDPGPWLHTLAGTVRLQAHAGREPGLLLDQVRQVADWSCLVLPHFATKSHQDPRAPQQLLPVRALEQNLRRRLGSAPLLRRRVTASLAASASAGEERSVE